jgi:hypothetical protein
MPEVLDPPLKFERGTSPGRHPWFLLADASGPPRRTFPPLGTWDGDGGERPDHEHCPRCNNVKAFICRCGYDWDNWQWVDGRNA